MPGTNEWLKINKDSTFEYTMRLGGDQYSSNGKWTTAKYKKNILFLKSNYDENNLPLIVKESLDKQTQGNFVRIKDFFSKAKDTILWTDLIINDSFSIEIKSNIIKIPINAGSIKKIQLAFSYNSYLRPDMSAVEEYTKVLKTEVYSVSDTSSNTFTLSHPVIKLPKFFHINFENEEFINLGKKLKWVKANKILTL